MPDIYISIGSNIDRKNNIQRAVNLLAKKFSNIKCSKVYESEAVGFDGDNFYNLVVKTTSNDVLETVLENLKKIEIECGRKNNKSEKKFSSRIIDLDLLLYGNTILHSEIIDIPRTDIAHYAFVLLPLSELAPDLQHPELKISFGKLWGKFTNEAGNIKQAAFLPAL
jgi:2-amino-4-hydroxy-6-hydroxymethyldihydropteridine diphosphokinase